MKTRTVLIVLAATLTGCAAVAKQVYRPVDKPATEWLIEGKQSGMGTLSIAINGTPVIDGKVSIWTGDGEFTGNYAGHSIAATCSKAQGSGVRTRCVLFVDGDKASTIYFKVLD